MHQLLFSVALCRRHRRRRCASFRASPPRAATPFFSLLLGRHFVLHLNFFLGIYGWIFLCCSGNFWFFEKLFWNSRYLPLSVFVILKNCLERWMTTTAIFLRSEEVALLLHSWRRSSLHKVSGQYVLAILHRCSSLLLFSSRFGFVACFFFKSALTLTKFWKPFAGRFLFPGIYSFLSCVVEAVFGFWKTVLNSGYLSPIVVCFFWKTVWNSGYYSNIVDVGGARASSSILSLQFTKWVIILHWQCCIDILEYYYLFSSRIAFVACFFHLYSDLNLKANRGE
jgi:hypothetical protein